MIVKKRIFNIIQIGNKEDVPSRLFDYLITALIVVNLVAVLFSTFEASAPYRDVIFVVGVVTAVVFSIEYVLRFWTADLLYPQKPGWKARLKFLFSFYGIVDLLTILPFYLPLLFPQGIVAFRMLRVVRILRLFTINPSYDSFNVITDVLKKKKNQIGSSIVLILILMLFSSMAMYSLEHEAQPEAFSNAFSGIWWSVSTLLTVGYGDIYPITVAGRIMAIVIAFLGVGMVAIPTGIISAGFVEQYTQAARRVKENEFEKLLIEASHPWAGKPIKSIDASRLLLIVLIQRGETSFVPNEETIIEAGDTLVTYKSIA